MSSRLTGKGTIQIGPVQTYLPLKMCGAIRNAKYSNGDCGQYCIVLTWLCPHTSWFHSWLCLSYICIITANHTDRASLFSWFTIFVSNDKSSDMTSAASSIKLSVVLWLLLSCVYLQNKTNFNHVVWSPVDILTGAVRSLVWAGHPEHVTHTGTATAAATTANLYNISYMRWNASSLWKLINRLDIMPK